MRTTPTFFIAVLTLCALAVFTATMVRALFYSPDTEIEVPAEREMTHDLTKVPVRITVPALGIDANVQEVGVTEGGNMGVPSNFTDVGWYKYGVVPGESGSAVIAGHVDNGLGLAGVFKRLGELEAGDDIYVEARDGTRLHFVVTGRRSYPHTDVPTEILFNPSGSVRLNLITCEGAWMQDERTYDQRLVVSARLADE